MTAFLIVALCVCGIWWVLNAFGVVASLLEGEGTWVFCLANIVVTTIAIIGLAMGLA